MAARRKATPRRRVPSRIVVPPQPLPRLGFNVTKLVLPFLVILLIGSAFTIGVLWTKLTYVQKQATSTATTAGTTTAQPAKVTVSLDQVKALFGQDYIKFGDANRKVLFVEVADPSCPYCHIAAGKNPELSKQVGSRFQYATDGGSYVPPVTEMKKLVDSGKASFVYIYYPGHGNGEMGVKSLYCAQEKGRFWEVHDLLMSKAGYDLLNTQIQNDKTKSGQLATFLSSAVPSGDMKACLDSGKYDQRPSVESQAAVSLGVQGTPGFFVNASAFNGAYSWTDMKSAVDAALK